MKKLLLFLSILFFNQNADAQIRVEGQIWPPKAVSQTQIEAAIEAALQTGRIENGGVAWSNMGQADIRYPYRHIDSVAFSSLRERGYFLDMVNAKTYCITPPNSGLFYLVRVVDCGNIFHIDGCALGITAICRMSDGGRSFELSKAQKRAYTEQLKQYLLSNDRLRF